jgi:two-component system, NtrC family, sensor kinase
MACVSRKGDPCMPEVSNQESGPLSGRPNIRRRWYRLYYLLAAFDILTVCVSFYLGHRILAIYRDSVSVNLAYSDRRRAISDLDTLAAAVNAPGNDIFDTHDVERERKNLRDAMDAFMRGTSIVREDFTKNLSPPDLPPLLQKLDLVESAARDISTDTEKIFSAVFTQAVEGAGKFMAATEHKHTFIITTLAKLRADSRAIEKKLFAKQEAQAQSLQRLEIVVVLSVLLMVIGATLYG